MVLLAAVVALAGSMAPAHYTAKSDLIDTECAGGWSTSTNTSWTMADVAVEAKGLKLFVKKNSCCGPSGDCTNILVLANGTGADVWLKASDSRLDIGREARDREGVWHPIEYRMQSTCGNSFHKVALQAGRAWVWDVPASSGAAKTMCRYVLHGLEKPVYSGEFEASVSLTDFQLPENLKGYNLLPDGSLSSRG